MLRAKIKTFLSAGGAFREGVQLLEAAGGDSKRFQQALSRAYVLPADRQRLQEALQKCLEQLIDDDLPAKVPVKATKAASATEPESIQALRAKGKKLLKRRAFLRGQLSSADTEQERYRLAREIMNEITPDIDRTYAEIREYEKNGTVPPMPEEKDIMRQAVDMFRRRESLRAIIARKKRTLEGIKGKERAALELDILENEEEYNSLNEKLGL
jgi:hypothetical protein